MNTRISYSGSALMVRPQVQFDLTEVLHDVLYSIPALGEELENEIGKSHGVSDDGKKLLTVEIYDYVHRSAGNKIDAEDVAWSYGNTSSGNRNAT